MITEQPLLDLLAAQMGCTYLSDLRFLSDGRRYNLAQKLVQLIPREKDLRDWNDALVYLTGVPPEQTAHAAKARLVEWLSKPCAAGRGQIDVTLQGESKR